VPIRLELVPSTKSVPDTFCLPGSLAAWKNLLRSIEPDLVLVDYCPGVLLTGKRGMPRFSRRFLRIFGRGKVYAL